jgi:hypothetical protein
MLVGPGRPPVADREARVPACHRTKPGRAADSGLAGPAATENWLWVLARTPTVPGVAAAVLVSTAVVGLPAGTAIRPLPVAVEARAGSPPLAFRDHP